MSGWKDPIFTGRVLAALLMSRDLESRNGQSLAVADLAREFAIA